MQYAPINPADIYTITTGGTYGDDQVQAPFPCGHDGVGIVTKVCYAFWSADPFVVPDCGRGLFLLLLNVHCSSVDPVANRKLSGRPAICTSTVACCHQVMLHLLVTGLHEWRLSETLRTYI